MTEHIGQSERPIIAFFGATGGCALAALDRALNAGFQARARK
jgi:hypothetical protein